MLLPNLMDLEVANLLMRERMRLAARAALAAEAVRAENHSHLKGWFRPWNWR